jgi:translocator protein
LGEIALPGQLRMSYLRWALVTVPAVLLLGLASGRLSGSGYGNAWFDALEKPAAMPPGWAFGAAWTTLYILLGLALALILNARSARGRGLAITLFIVQLLLNYAWSPTFFAAHQVWPALFLILAIFVLATITTVLFGRIRRGAALLMLPYLAWLGFAAGLNWDIARLNPHAADLAPRRGGAQIRL